MEEEGGEHRAMLEQCDVPGDSQEQGETSEMTGIETSEGGMTDSAGPAPQDFTENCK